MDRAPGLARRVDDRAHVRLPLTRARGMDVRPSDGVFDSRLRQVVGAVWFRDIPLYVRARPADRLPRRTLMELEFCGPSSRTTSEPASREIGADLTDTPRQGACRRRRLPAVRPRPTI